MSDSVSEAVNGVVRPTHTIRPPISYNTMMTDDDEN